MGNLDNCEKCGKDIYMSGSRICKICDPDLEALIGGAKSKTPSLCDRCHDKHLEEHKNERTSSGSI